MGFCNYYSGYLRMYAELSGPLHKMLQVGNFDSRKGSKMKLAWTPEAEDAFDRLKERLLGQLGFFPWTPTRDLCCAQTTRTMLLGQLLIRSGTTGRMFLWCFGDGSWLRASAERGPLRRGDICHRVCAQEVVGPHRTAAGCGVYSPSVAPELKQGAEAHSLGTGS